MKLIEVYRTTNQRRDLATAPPKCQSQQMSLDLEGDWTTMLVLLDVSRGWHRVMVGYALQSPRPHVGRSEIFGLYRNLSSRNSDKNQGKSMLRQATLLLALWLSEKVHYKSRGGPVGTTRRYSTARSLVTAPRRCVIGKNGRLLASTIYHSRHDTQLANCRDTMDRHVKLPRLPI